MGLVASALRPFRIRAFAQTNGLVYLGPRGSEDDAPVRGFTAQTGQFDSHVMAGSVAGHEITILERTVVHKKSHGHHHSHAHTWLVARIALDAPDIRHLLMLSQEHGRLIEEASFLHDSHERHVAIDYRLDASFLIYARPGDVEAVRERLTASLVGALLAHPSYDYEFDAGYMYVYAHGVRATVEDLSAILTVSLHIADSVASQ